MDERRELIQALTSKRRFIPYWMQYDWEGSQAFIDSSDLNKDYYLPAAEKQLLQKHMHELMSTIQKPFLIADLGCGNAEKSHHFIREYLRERSQVLFAPVDMCGDVIDKVAETMTENYGDKVQVFPCKGDFSTSLPQLFGLQDKKLIVSFSAMLNMEYTAQMKFLRTISDSMTKDDRLIMSFDITQDKGTIEEAYLDKEGYFDKQMMRAVERLNEEYGANFNTDDFVIEGEFIPHEDDTIPGALHRWLQFRKNQTIFIHDLNIELNFDKDDRLYLAEYGDTHKYTDTQIEILANKSKLKINQMWKHPNCVLVMMQKQC